jgi:serine/threonine protein kinase
MYCPECYGEMPDDNLICEQCGCPAENSARSEKKILKDRYEIISSLATGGMGEIYMAYDLRLKRPCVVKGHYKKGLEKLPHNIREQIVKPFEKEAEMLANLRHASLPCVTDYFIEKDTCYIIMDHIEGNDLEVILSDAEGKGLPEKQVIEWAVQICRILEYLHSQKPPLIHGDIKPANIIIREADGWLVLVDFGSASFSTLKPDKKEVYGTDGYAAPEQYLGVQEVRSDIYSLGCTMYELLTGALGEENFIFLPPRKIIPELSSDLEIIIMKCLEFNINNRFADVKELKENLLASYSRNFGRKSKTVSEEEKKNSEEESVQKNIKVFIIDNDSQMCDKYKEKLSSCKDIEIINIISNVEQAVYEIFRAKDKPDVILIDINIPVIDGIKATKIIKEISPSTKIIILSDSVIESEVLECFNNGASSYLTKSDALSEDLEKAIRNAFLGGLSLSSQVSLMIIKNLSDQNITETKKCLYCNRLNTTQAKYCNECGKNIFHITENGQNNNNEEYEEIIEEIIYFDENGEEIDGEYEEIIEEDETLSEEERNTKTEEKKDHSRFTISHYPSRAETKKLEELKEKPGSKKFTLKKTHSDKPYGSKMPVRRLKKLDQD